MVPRSYLNQVVLTFPIIIISARIDSPSAPYSLQLATHRGFLTAGCSVRTYDCTSWRLMDPRMVNLRGVGSPSSRPVLQQGKCFQAMSGISTPVLGDIFRNARLFDENVTVILADAAFYHPMIKCINDKKLHDRHENCACTLASWLLPTLSFMTFDPRLLKHGLLIYGEYGKRFVLTTFICLANLTL